MNKLIKNKWMLLLAVLGFGVSSCGDLTELNIDPNSPVDVPASNLVTQAQFSLYNNLHSRNYNAEWTMLCVQHWAQSEYAEESRYLVDANTFDGRWQSFYASVLNELAVASRKIASDENVPAARKANQLAIIEVLTVDAFQSLTDGFGDIPYSQALNPEFPNPQYDSQSAIYADLLQRLDAALASMDVSSGSFDSGDIIFGGDVASWKKLGASLLLRAAMRVSDVDSGAASTYVGKALGYGVIANNAENALFNFDSDPNLSNPLYIDAVLSNRDDFRVTDVLINHMEASGDARLASYASVNNDNVYKGMPYGLTDAEAFALKSTTSKPNDDRVRAATAPHVIIDAAEVSFLMAEAVERGFATGSATDSYNSGVTNSFEYWGVGDAAADYLANNSYDSSNWKQSIGTQKWLAFYMNGPQAWAEWRRLDQPALSVPAAAVNPAIPVRLPYPISEDTRNGSSLDAVTSDINDLNAKLWWDVN